MEAFFSTLFMSNADWFDQEISQNTYWTKEENKRFEHALAIYGEDVPDRWIKVAEMIPGKTVSDVIKQYRELEEDVSDIEAGRVPIPCYPRSSFVSELVDNHDFHGYRKRCNGAKGSDHERKKGVPWTLRVFPGLKEGSKSSNKNGAATNVSRIEEVDDGKTIVSQNSKFLQSSRERQKWERKKEMEKNKLKKKERRKEKGMEKKKLMWHC